MEKKSDLNREIVDACRLLLAAADVHMFFSTPSRGRVQNKANRKQMVTLGRKGKNRLSLPPILKNEDISEVHLIC